MIKARVAICRICAVAAVGVAAPTWAAPEVVPSITVSGGALYTSNPFLSPGVTPDGSAVSIEVAPSVEIIGDRTQGIISGNIGYTQYLGSLGSTSGYRVQGVVLHRANDRLSLNARASFDSSILGARGFNDPLRTLPFAQDIDPAPGTVPVPGAPVAPSVTPPLFATDGPILGLGTSIIDSDLGLLGARQRRNLWSASGGLDYRSSARSTWSAEVNFSRASYPGGSIITEDYSSYGVTLGYRRALSETTSVGAGVGASRVDYARSPGSSVYSPRISISQRLRGGLSWNANAGVAFVSQATGTSTSAFADASLCRTTLKSLLCLSASYAPSITGVGSVRNQVGVSANYSYRLAERTSLSASVGYTQLPAQSGLLLNVPRVRPAQSFLTSDVVLNRRFSRAVSGYLGASYRKLDDSTVNVKADYGVRIGIAFTLSRRP